MTYSDKNTKLFDGQELTEKSDIEMRQSLLFNLYLNMSVCYMKMNNFSNALQCINDAIVINEKNS